MSRAVRSLAVLLLLTVFVWAPDIAVAQYTIVGTKVTPVRKKLDSITVAQSKLFITEVTPPKLELYPIKPAATLKITPIPVLKRVEPVEPKYPKFALAPLPPKPTIAPRLLPPIELEEPEVHLYKGKKPTIPEGNFYQGTHPFNTINWGGITISGSATVFAGTLSVAVGDHEYASIPFIDGRLVLDSQAELSYPVPEPCSLFLSLLAGSISLATSRRSSREAGRN